MKRPIILILISYIIGIIIFEFIQINFNLIVIFILLILVIYIKFSKKNIIYFCFIILGIFITYHRYPSIKIYKKVKLNAEIINKKQGKFNNKYEIKSNGINYIFKNKINLKKGDYISIEGDISKPHDKNNFKTFNYNRYLRSKNIFYQIIPKKVHKLYSKNRIKTSIFENIENLFENNLSSTSSKLMKSMILGIREKAIQDNIFENFNSLGLSHVLAISGLHLTILIKILDFIGEKLNLSRKKYGIVIIIMLIFYGYIIDFPVSLIRSILMYIIGLVAIYTNNIRDKLNSLFFAMLITLIINPLFIYSVGFYLSYSSLFGILYIYKKMKLLFINTNDKFLIHLSIQLSIFPFLTYFYNNMNILSILINILIIPVISIGVFLGFIYSITRIYLFTYIIEAIFYIVKLSIIPFNIISNLFIIKFNSFGIREFIVYYLVLITLLNFKIVIYTIKKKKLSKYILIISLIIVCKNIFINNVYINFIDVGQGDSILIRSKDKNLLYDTGGEALNLEYSGKKIYEYFYKNNVSKLDNVVISHSDMDHYGNLLYLVNNIKINKLYANNLPRFKTQNLKKNDKIYLKNCEFKVILDGANRKSTNDSSIVILANIHGYNLLLTGDVEENESNIKIPNIDFLKVAHHGSKHSTKEIFLKNNNIKIAFISVGYNNRYGHPTKEVIERLKNKNIKIYRTDLDGNIELVINEISYHIRSYNSKYDILELIKYILLF